MTVESYLDEDTSIQLAFPRITAPNWIAQEIRINAEPIIVVLDDDASIHTAWKLRFNPIFDSHPDLRLHRFNPDIPLERSQVCFF